jgi:transposase
MLLVGYCYSIRSERRLCQEVELNLAFRWFCRLIDADDRRLATRCLRNVAAFRTLHGSFQSTFPITTALAK